MKKSSLAKATDVAKLKKTVAKSSKEIAALKSKLVAAEKAVSKLDKKTKETSTDLKKWMTKVKLDLSGLAESAEITDYLLCYTIESDGTKRFKLTIDVADLNPLSDIEVPISPRFNADGDAVINLVRKDGSHSSYDDLVVFSGVEFPSEWRINLNIISSVDVGRILDSIWLPPAAPGVKEPEIECP